MDSWENIKIDTVLTESQKKKKTKSEKWYLIIIKQKRLGALYKIRSIFLGGFVPN